MNPAQFGRYGDNTMVHMNNEEVAGLASLAKSMGRELTINPDTGYPEAFSLKDALPTIVGLGAGLMTANPWLIGTAVGGTTAATTGSLEQGVLAGLTAGALSGIGGELAAQGAGAAPIAEQTTSQAIFDQAGKQIGTQVVPDVAKNQAISAAQQNAARLAGQNMSPATLSRVMESQYGSQLGGQIPGQIASRASAQAMPLGTTKVGQMYQGAKNILSDPSGQALKGFAQSQAVPIATAAVGQAGQAQYAMQEDMETRKEELDRQKAAQLEKTRAGIRQSYANVGRALPTNPYTGRPVFANGGIVGLMEGGRPFDSAPGKMSPEEQAFLAALMGGADSDKMKSAADALKESKEKKYADGGSVRPGYTTNIYGEQIPVTRWNGEVGGKGGFSGMLGQLFGQMFGPNAQITQDIAADARMPKHDAFVGKLQTGMGNQKALDELEKEGYYNGGYLQTGGRVGDGMSDDIPAMIDGDQPAALSDGEFVIPADVVSHLGNGSSDAGAQQLYSMMDRIRQARTGTTDQGKEINAKKMMPA